MILASIDKQRGVTRRRRDRLRLIGLADLLNLCGAVIQSPTKVAMHSHYLANFRSIKIRCPSRPRIFRVGPNPSPMANFYEPVIADRHNHPGNNVFVVITGINRFWDTAPGGGERPAAERDA